MANKELLDHCNEVANAEITLQLAVAKQKLHNAEASGGNARRVRLVGEVNSWIDRENTGSFDCTHYTFDACGNLVRPRVHR